MMAAYRSHVDSIPVVPLVLKVLLQFVLQWILDLVELDELADSPQLRVVSNNQTSRSSCKSQNLNPLLKLKSIMFF